MTMATIRCPNCGYMGRPERYLRWGRFLGYSILATILGLGVFCATVAKYYEAYQSSQQAEDSGAIFVVLFILAPVVYALIAYFTRGYRCPSCKYPYVAKR